MLQGLQARRKLGARTLNAELCFTLRSTGRVVSKRKDSRAAAQGTKASARRVTACRRGRLAGMAGLVCCTRCIGWDGPDLDLSRRACGTLAPETLARGAARNTECSTGQESGAGAARCCMRNAQPCLMFCRSRTQAYSFLCRPMFQLLSALPRVYKYSVSAPGFSGTTADSCTRLDHRVLFHCFLSIVEDLRAFRVTLPGCRVLVQLRSGSTKAVHRGCPDVPALPPPSR